MKNSVTPSLPTPLLCMLASGFWLLCLSGCGYNSSSSSGYQWHSLYREDVRTVAVPIFTNRDMHRGVEFNLTKAVVSQLESHTPYKVVSRESADTILEGEITSVHVTPISLSLQTALPQEQMLSIRVNFTWKMIKTGQILAERRNFEQTATYYPSLGEGSFTGSQNAIEKLGLAIVQELQAEW